MSEDKNNPKTEPILDRVLEFSRSRGLFECGIILVGLSGGPDSVSLLCILKSLKDRKDIDCDIVAFHCNHHLRPGVCDEEAEQVRTLCKDLGIDIKVIDFDCAGFAKTNHISEETAGRLLRYEAFEQYAQSLEKAAGKTVRIAIAHHEDDIAETMMMNLFRGSGLEGLVNPKSRTGRLIRPLLCVRKSELISFLEGRQIKYATDLTNLQAIGTRNVWRNEILPKIGECYNGDPAVPLARTYNLLSDDLDFITKSSVESYASCRKILSGHPVLSVSGIRDLHPAMKSRAVRYLWQETFGELIDFEEGHLKDCFSLCDNAVTGEKTLDMPFGRKAYRHGDIFAFTAEDGIADLACKVAGAMGFLTAGGAVNICLNLDGIRDEDSFRVEIPNSAYILKIRIIENKQELEYNNLLWFCPIEAFGEGNITIGNINGTGSALRIRKAGAAGGKELNRLMTDLKIPESARKQILFVERDGEVLWLPGFGHSIGFTSAASREKYIADRQGEGNEPESLAMFVIERQ